MKYVEHGMKFPRNHGSFANRGKKFLSLSPVLRLTQRPTQTGQEVLYPRSERPEHEAELSPPSTELYVHN